MKNKIKNKNAILKAALVMGISALALTACETGDWFEDDATYAGDVKPPVETVETSAPSNQIVPPPNQEIMNTLPPANQEFTSGLTPPPASTTTTVTTTTEAPPAPPVAAPNQYSGNLASVPPRPQPSELPAAAQVQAARQDLTADNQRLTGTLKDPYQVPPPVQQAQAPQPYPLIPPTQPPAPVPAAQAATPAMVTTTTVTQQPAPMPQQPYPTYAPPVPQPAPVAMAPQPYPVQQPQPYPVYAPPPVQQAQTPQPYQPAYAPPVMQPVQPLYQAQYAAPPPVPYQPPYPTMAAAPAPTDQNVSGRLLGLKPSGPGKYSLVQLVPDTGIGSFAMSASIITSPPGNQINVTQYADLRRVAAQYGAQKGRVRLVSYSNDPQSQDALQRATTVAAYLIDLGVPSSAIRMRIDPAPADATQAAQAARKTDVFLEVPISK